MKKLLKYLKDYKVETVMGPLFKLLEASFELIVPLVVAAIIDKGIGQTDKPYIIRMGLVLVLLGAVGFTCSVIAQYFAAKAAVGVSGTLRRRLFSRIMGMEASEVDKNEVLTLCRKEKIQIFRYWNNLPDGFPEKNFYENLIVI